MSDNPCVLEAAREPLAACRLLIGD